MKIALAGALVAATLATPALAGDVTVTITGVKPNAGPVLAVLQTQDQFAQAQGTYTGTAEAKGSTVRVVFRNVAEGTYAAAAFQDTNNDGTTTIGATGPTEPWGLSGPAQKGAPAFGPASKKVTARGGTMSVRLKAVAPAM